MARVDFYSLTITDSTLCTTSLDNITMDEPECNRDIGYPSFLRFIAVLMVDVGATYLTCAGGKTGRATAIPTGTYSTYIHIIDN